MGSASRPRLFLIDGSALAYRAHFAFIRAPLVTSKGVNSSAVFGFAQALFRVLDRENPKHWAVAFDTKAKTFRHRQFPDYKATREKAPDELTMQMSRIHELVEAFGLPVVELPGFEADDLIGTLAKRAEEQGFDVFVVSSDKDFLQLVTDHVRVYNITKSDKDVEILGPTEVVQKFSVGPAQVIDVLALMGDTSDNVPGVPSVGEKTATALIHEFGSLDGVYRDLDRVTRPALRQKLAEHKDQAYLSRQLVTIDTQVAIELDSSAFEWHGFDAGRLRALFLDLEFSSFLPRLSAAATAPAAETRFTVIETVEQADELARALASAPAFAIQPAVARDAEGYTRTGFAFSSTAGEASFVASGSGASAPLERLRPLLENTSSRKVGHDLKRSMLALREQGIALDGPLFDTMIASYCLDPGALQHGLEYLAVRYLNHRFPAHEERTPGKRGGKAEPSRDDLRQSALEQAEVIARLPVVLEPELDRLAVRQLFDRVETPLLSVLAEMEWHGVRVDFALLDQMRAQLEQRLAVLTEEIYAIAGMPFNINSPQQLGQVLFEDLKLHQQVGLKRVKKTKTGYATDAAVLQSLAAHPLAQKLLDFRQIQKLQSTYIDALPMLKNPRTGRIHTSFNQAVAATGRLSSSDPNLQNIPIRTDIGREIRRAFVPSQEGGTILSADYSQVELRLLAHVSRDPHLIEAFQRGDDIHRSTAALIFRVAPAEVSSQMRAHAKTINFGIIYGMGPQRLGQEIDVSFVEAQQFIQAYFKAFAGVRAYLDETLARAVQDGYVTTLLGRRRYLPDIASNDPRVKATMQNAAINTPIQGTAADMIKLAMIRAHRALQEQSLATRMIIQVHDELVFDVAPGESETVRPLVRESMERALELTVPIVVDMGEGRSWFEAH